MVSHFVSLGLTWSHVISPGFTLGTTTHAATNGTGEQRLPRPTAPGNSSTKHSSNPSKTNKSLPGPTRNLQKASRKHQRCSRNSQNNFLFHFARKSSTNPKGTRTPRTTNRTPEPQRQDHAHRSHSDFPVSSPKPPITMLTSQMVGS